MEYSDDGEEEEESDSEEVKEADIKHGEEEKKESP